MSDTADPVFHIFYTIKTHSGSIEMSQKNKTRSTRMRRPNPGTIAPPHGCRSDGERICEDGSCIARVELCPEEQLMNQNTVLIMVVVGLAVVVFLVILYCFQQRQRRANRQLGIDSGMSDDCDNESLFAPPPAYEEVINSINMYPATSEQRRLRQLSQEEPTSPMTPPPNYASALIILAQSAESLLSKDTQSNIVRRSVSLDQVQDAANNSTRRYTDLPEKNRHSRTRNIFRFSRQFSRTSATSNGNNNTNTRPGESPKIPRSPPPYPQSPVVIAQSPPPPLTPLTSGSQCNIQEVTCTNIEVFT